MEHLSRDSPANDDELLRWYREATERAVGYGRDRGLFDVPTDYRLEIVPTPPVLRSTIDAAYYPAPPFKRNGVGRFYLTPTGNDPGQLKANNRASVADTAVHEGFPGHDWHFKYMTQHAAEIANIRWLTPGAVEDSAAMWEDSMATEGWALYSEELRAEPGSGAPARRLHACRASLRAPGTAAAGRPRPRGRRSPYRPHDVRPGRGLLHRARAVLPRGLRSGWARPSGPGALRDRDPGDLSVLQVADASRDLQSRQERNCGTP